MKIGIDIGGTKIKAGLVEGSKILKKIEIATEANKGKTKVMENIVRAVELIYEKDVEGIGVGFAGVVDAKKGTILISPHIPALEGFNLKKFLEKKFKKKVAIEHEAPAATLAEAKYWGERGYKNMVMITIGTGIGGGIIIDGKLYKGRGNAGEFAHTTINFEGIKSTCCKNYGCFEEYVSTRGLQKIYGSPTNPKEIALRAMKGDMKAKKAYEEMGKILGYGLANISNIFDPEIIIINGGIARSWNLFKKETIKTMNERGFLKTKVVKAKQEDAGIIGAALLIK